MTAGYDVPLGTRSRRGLIGLLAGAGISVLGTRMSFLAVPWFVLITTGSAAQTGLVAFAEMMPYVLTQGLAGPFIDRVGLRRVSVGTDVLAALALGAVPVLHALDRLGLPLLCLCVAAAGVMRGAGDSARYLMVPAVTDAAAMPLERGAGLADGVERVAGLVGAPLAGFLIALTSAPLVLLVDAGTFLVSAAVVGWLVPRQPPADDGSAAAPDAAPDAAGYLQQMREGLGFLRRDRLLMGITAMVLVTNLVDQALGSVLMPVWAKEQTGSAVTLGLMAGTFGAGAVLGNLLFTWLSPRLPRRLTFAWCFLLCGGPRIFALALLGSLSPILVVFFLCAIGTGGINPVLGAVEYERVPERLRARVLGASGALMWAGIPVGALAGGFGVEHLGLTNTLLLAGTTYLVTTLAPFVFPVWREMERSEPWHDRSEPLRLPG